MGEEGGRGWGEVGAGGKGGRMGGRMGGDEGGGLRGIGGRMNSQLSQMLNTCAAKSPGNPGNYTNLAFFGGVGSWAGRVLASNAIVLDRDRIRNFAARPCPSLCKIPKAASISSFEHVSERKGTPSPRSRQRSRP